MIMAQWIRGRNGDIMLCVSCWVVSDSLWPYGLSPQKDELPRLVGAWYATGEEWRNSSRKNEEMEPNFILPSCGCDQWWKWSPRL